MTVYLETIKKLGKMDHGYIELYLHHIKTFLFKNK